MEVDGLLVVLKLEMVIVGAGSVVATPLIVAKDAGIVVTAPLAIFADVGLGLKRRNGRNLGSAWWSSDCCR